MRQLVGLFLSICFPIVTGIAVLMTIQYKFTFTMLDEWRQLTRIELMLSEKKKLHNYCYSNKLLSEIYFQGVMIYNLFDIQCSYLSLKIEQDIVRLKKFYKNVHLGNVATNSLFTPQICPTRDFQQKNIDCPQIVHDLYNRNRNLINFWFHRTSHFKSELSQIDLQYLQENLIFMTLAKAIYQTKKSELLDEEWLYNSYPTTFMLGVPAAAPSLTFKFQDCKGNDFTEPYDPRCRPWYILAEKSSHISFQKPYIYARTSQVGMTASDKIEDVEESAQSIISIDFGISNLVNSIFKKQDIYNSTSIYEGYSVLFHEDNFTVLYHKSMNKSEETSWADLEFPNGGDQKNLFVNNLKNAVTSSSELNNFEFQNTQNTQLFFNFTKQKIEYIGLMYPIQVSSFSNDWKTISTQSVLLLARVQKQLVEVLLDNILYFSNIMVWLTIVESIIIILITLIFLLQFTYLLFKQVWIPLGTLTLFLKQNDLLLNKKKLAIKILPTSNVVSKQDLDQIRDSLPHLTLVTSGKEQGKAFTINSPLNSSTQEHKLSFLQSPAARDKSRTKNSFFKLGPQTSRRNTDTLGNQISPCNDSIIGLNIEKTYLSFPQIHTTQQNEMLNDPQCQFLSPRFPSFQKSTFSQSIKLSEFDSAILFKSLKRQRQKSSSSITFCNSNKLEQKIDLADIIPSCQEIKVIKETFIFLSQIISFEKEEGFSRNENENKKIRTASFLRFSRASQTFQSIGNTQAMVLCHFNLGQIHKEDNNLSDAIISFNQSFQISLYSLGFHNIQEFFSFLDKGNLPSNDFFINHIRILSQQFARTLKMIIQKKIAFGTSPFSQYLDDYCSGNNYIAFATQLLEISNKLEKRYSSLKKEIKLFNKADLVELDLYSGNIERANLNLMKIESEFILSSNEDFPVQYNQFKSLQSNIIFLNALLQFKKRNYLQAAIYFTEFIEESQNIDPEFFEVSLSLLEQIFAFYNERPFQLEKLMKKNVQKSLKQFNIILILFESANNTLIQEQINFMQWLQTQMMDPKRDKLSVFSFSSDLFDPQIFAEKIKTIQENTDETSKRKEEDLSPFKFKSRIFLMPSISIKQKEISELNSLNYIYPLNIIPGLQEWNLISRLFQKRCKNKINLTSTLIEKINFKYPNQHISKAWKNLLNCCLNELSSISFLDNQKREDQISQLVIVFSQSQYKLIPSESLQHALSKQLESQEINSGVKIIEVLLENKDKRIEEEFSNCNSMDFKLENPFDFLEEKRKNIKFKSYEKVELCKAYLSKKKRVLENQNPNEI